MSGNFPVKNRQSRGHHTYICLCPLFRPGFCRCRIRPNASSSFFPTISSRGLTFSRSPPLPSFRKSDPTVVTPVSFPDRSPQANSQELSMVSLETSFDFVHDRLVRLQSALPTPDPDVAAGEIGFSVDFVLISPILKNKNSILKLGG